MKKYLTVLDEIKSSGERMIMQVHAESLKEALEKIGEYKFSSPVLGIFTPEGKSGAFDMARVYC